MRDGADLFVLRFYGPVNPLGSYLARSVYLITLTLDRLSPLSSLPVLCTFFCKKEMEMNTRVDVKNVKVL